MKKYTKAILALAGVLLPFLESIGAPLPEFLTLDWLQGIILAVTPVLVFYFPNRDELGKNVAAQSPVWVAVLATLLTALMISGCGGTIAAYKAADGLEETAWVMNQHFLALVREGNDLKRQGVLAGSALSTAQDLVRTGRPILKELSQAAQVYEAVRSADNQDELTVAIAAAAVQLSKLVNAIRAAGGSAELLDEIELDLDQVLLAAA